MWQREREGKKKESRMIGWVSQYPGSSLVSLSSKFVYCEYYVECFQALLKLVAGWLKMTIPGLSNSEFKNWT